MTESTDPLMELKRAFSQREKPLHELVFEEDFIVLDVLSQTYGTSFTPHSEMVFGGRSPSYSGGQTSELVLKVQSTKVPVTSLKFRGISAVRGGDSIRAKIPRYEKREIFRNVMEPMCGDNDMTREGYFPRDAYNPEEEAIEITILRGNGISVRTDRAVDYARFERR